MNVKDSRHWRLVALSSQVPSGQPVRVSCGDGDYVLFRDAAGVCRALLDRCAHRRAPLSQGRLTEQYLIECPYHGWRYNGTSGACVAIPNLRTHEKIPGHYRVPAFETMERDGFVQILLGDGDAAAQPRNVELPGLERRWEGERLLAYPEELLMDTVLDCPSSILRICGVQILDDHPIGDPVASADRMTVEYAAVKARRTHRMPKRAAPDFAFVVRISVTGTEAQVTICSGAQLQAAAVFAAVGMGRRITRVLWRGAGNAVSASQFEIACHNHVDPLAMRARNNHVSQTGVGALTASTLG